MALEKRLGKRLLSYQSIKNSIERTMMDGQAQKRLNNVFGTMKGLLPLVQNPPFRDWQRNKESTGS